ncbi:MAG: CPBP family intramembrane glutamic endopeptidase [Phycisphaerales bacterium]
MNELAHGISVLDVGRYEDRPHPKTLLVETAAVVVGTLTAIRFLHTSSIGVKWLLIPCMLVIAALAPTWAARRDFPRVGLHPEPIRLALRTVTLVCLCILPPVYLGLWLLTSHDLPIPLRPTLAPGEDRLTWLLYQFLYVAAAEEVFFRGYLQANAMRILGMRYASRAACGTPEDASRTTHDAQRTTHEWIAITISAGCFALAHVVVQGHIASAVTFLPGLLMAWLFVRTRSLLAPILFHGLANVSYGIMTAILM